MCVRQRYIDVISHHITSYTCSESFHVKLVLPTWVGQGYAEQYHSLKTVTVRGVVNNLH